MSRKHRKHQRRPLCEALANRVLLSAVVNVLDVSGVNGDADELTGAPGHVIHVHAGDVDGTTASLDILSTRYQWDFGDVVSGTEAEFDHLEGFSAAHAYDRDGTFTLRLTQTAPDGTVTTATKTVIISDPTSAPPVIYVDAVNGNDSNSGTQASPVKTSKQAEMLLSDPIAHGDNTQIFFHRGQTFTLWRDDNPSDGIPQASETGFGIFNSNVLIGAYSTGSNPVLSYVQPKKFDTTTNSWVDDYNIGVFNIAYLNGIHDVTFQNLTIATDASSTQTPVALQIQDAKNVAVRDCDFEAFAYGVDANTGTARGSAGLLMLKNTASGFCDYVLYDSGTSDVVVLGNTWDVTTSTDGVVRVNWDNNLGSPLLQRFLFAGNTLTQEGEAAGVRLHRLQYAFVTDNTLHCGLSGETCRATDPTKPCDTDPASKVQYVVVQRNSFSGELNCGGGTDGLMVRNNVLNVPSSGHLASAQMLNVQQPMYINAANTALGFDGQAKNVFFYNNTGFRASGDNLKSFLRITAPSESSRIISGQITIASNLYVTPSGWSDYAVYILNDDSMSSVAEIHHNIWPAYRTLNAMYVGADVSQNDWNGYAGKVSSDAFTNISLSNPSVGDYTPTSNIATAIKVEDVFNDLKGNLRPTIGVSPGAWTAGAVQVADLLTFRDVNNPVYPGSFSVNMPGTDYTLVAGGSDIYGTADQFLFGWKQLSVPFDYRVQVYSITGPDTYTIGGLMARTSLSGDSKNIFVGRTAGDGFRIGYRDTTGGDTTPIFGGYLGPNGANSWVRLRWDGTTYSAYDSQDGNNWELIGQLSLNLGSTVYVGLALTAHDEGHSPSDSATADFRNLSTVASAGILLDGTPGDDNWYLQRSSGNVNIWKGTSPSGTPFETEVFADVNVIYVSGLAGDDTLVLDCANGTVVPASGGLSFDGGSGSDGLSVLGSASADTVTFAAGVATFAGSITFSNVEAVSFDGRGGGDTLAVSGGTITLPATQHFSSLTISGSGKVQLPLQSQATATLVTDTLSITGNGQLDIRDNCVIVNYLSADTSHATRDLIRNY